MLKHRRARRGIRREFLSINHHDALFVLVFLLERISEIPRCAPLSSKRLNGLHDNHNEGASNFPYANYNLIRVILKPAESVSEQAHPLCSLQGVGALGPGRGEGWPGVCAC
jgi:hypothetical protein